jgi:hypothetical protein
LVLLAYLDAQEAAGAEAVTLSLRSLADRCRSHTATVERWRDDLVRLGVLVRTELVAVAKRSPALSVGAIERWSPVVWRVPFGEAMRAIRVAQAFDELHGGARSTARTEPDGARTTARTDRSWCARGSAGTGVGMRAPEPAMRAPIDDDSAAHLSLSSEEDLLARQPASQVDPDPDAVRIVLDAIESDTQRTVHPKSQFHARVREAVGDDLEAAERCIHAFARMPSYQRDRIDEHVNTVERVVRQLRRPAFAAAPVVAAPVLDAHRPFERPADPEPDPSIDPREHLARARTIARRPTTNHTGE